MKETKINQTPNRAQNILDNFANSSIKIFIRELEAERDQWREKAAELEAKINQPPTNQELLFNLIKRLESGEIVLVNEDERYTATEDLFFKDNSSGEKVYIGRVLEADCREDGCIIGISYEYEISKNDKFKAKFYQKKDKKDNPLTKIQGILTSNLRTRKSSDTPYMAFLWLEDCIDCHNAKELCQTLRPKHSNGEECAENKCQECEIPVVFRVKSQEIIHKNCWTAGNCQNCKREEIKPKLKKGNTAILEGEFAESKKSSRPSFTCYSYQLINSHE